jgi:hypothetical protein
MGIKRCLACGDPFPLRTQSPDQSYCSAPECQRQRRKLWQREAPDRRRLPPEPGPGTAEVARQPARLLAAVPRRAPGLHPTQSRATARAQRHATRRNDCKDGRVKARAGAGFRHLPTQRDRSQGHCKDGRVDRRNHSADKHLSAFRRVCKETTRSAFQGNTVTVAARAATRLLAAVPTTNVRAADRGVHRQRASFRHPSR